VHGPPDKIFEEAAFLERFRNLLVMEQNDSLWIARGAPRAWLEAGQKIVVKYAPTHFGVLSYEILSDIDNRTITATLAIPSRQPPKSVWLRLRHPQAVPMKEVTVKGKPYKGFDSAREIIRLEGFQGTVAVTAQY
jgi:hypothetical protein